MPTYPALNLSVTIERPWDEVYEFAHVPAGFRLWASGLADFLEQTGDSVDVPDRVRFTPRNEFGIMDHWVITEPGSEVYVPLRVIANGTGCEVILTLFRTSGMSEEIMERDAGWVRRDLAKLKGLLEG
jgi:hypothetical protein